MKLTGYEMEELLPLVAKLAAKYTSGESSSVPYETANMLMESICYCILENEREGGRETESEAGKHSQVPKRNGERKAGESNEAAENISGEQVYKPLKTRQMTAAESFRQGYEKVLKKTGCAQKAYNDLIVDFQAYGNENYRDVVLKALPIFFMKYDPRFAPQETIISLNYPTLRTVSGDTGIDAVEQYVEYIVLEQRFLQKFSEDMVIKILTRFSGEYRINFFNLCSVVLRHVLVSGLLGRQPGEQISEEEYVALGQICAGKDKNELAELLNKLTEKLAAGGWKEDQKVLWYLQGDTDNFAAELVEGTKRNTLYHVVS